jgi:hypothetical protein
MSSRVDTSHLHQQANYMVKNGGSIPPLPHTPLRQTFTFTPEVSLIFTHSPCSSIVCIPEVMSLSTLLLLGAQVS